jgi:Putative adipose-regulatory protein (Seipin)
MLSSQPYATFIEIELPRSKPNLELGQPSQFPSADVCVGNFMISLLLINSDNLTVAASSRPAIMTYMSPLVSTSLSVLNAPFVVAGFKKESETLLVPLMERFQFTSRPPAKPSWAYISVTPDDNKIEIYSAKLMFVAQFEGVKCNLTPLSLILGGLCIPTE